MAIKKLKIENKNQTKPELIHTLTMIQT